MGSKTPPSQAGLAARTPAKRSEMEMAKRIANAWSQYGNGPDTETDQSEAFYKAAAEVIEAGRVGEVLDILEVMADRGDEMDEHDMVTLRMDLSSVGSAYAWEGDQLGAGRVLLVGIPLGGDFHEVREMAARRERDLMSMVRPLMGIDKRIEMFSLGVLRAGEAVDMARSPEALLPLIQGWAGAGTIVPQDLDRWRADPPEKTQGKVVAGGHVLVLGARLMGLDAEDVSGMDEPDIGDSPAGPEDWEDEVDDADLGHFIVGAPAGLARASIQAVAIHMEMDMMMTRMLMDDGDTDASLMRVEIEARTEGENGFDLHAHFDDGTRLTLEAALPEHLTALVAPIATHFQCEAVIDFGDGVFLETSGSGWEGGEVGPDDDLDLESGPVAFTVPGNRTIH